MGRCSWHVTIAVSQFAGLVMSTRGVMATSAAPSVTLAISGIKVNLGSLH